MLWLSFAFISAFFATIAAVLEKKVLFREHTIEFAATLAIVCALVSLPLSFVADFSNIDPFTAVLTVAASVPMSMGYYLIVKSIRRMELSEIAPVLALAPLFTTALAFLFLGERITAVQFVGMLEMAFGIAVLQMKSDRVVMPRFRESDSRIYGYALFGLFLYGLSAIFDRIILNVHNVDPAAYIVLIHLSMAAIFLFVLLVAGFSTGTLVRGIGGSLPQIVLISGLTVAQRYFTAYAVAMAASLGLVVAIKRLSTLVTVFSGGHLFREREMRRKVLASLIILGGASLLVL